MKVVFSHLNVFVQLQLKALQTLASIFQCPERCVSVPFIHALAPVVVMLLNNSCAKKPATSAHLEVCTEAIKLLEILVELTDNTLRK